MLVVFAGGDRERLKIVNDTEVGDGEELNSGVCIRRNDDLSQREGRDEASADLEAWRIFSLTRVRDRV